MRILIGIQARSKSTRLPGKIFMDVGGKPMLLRVVETCKEVSPMNRAVQVVTMVLTPEGDTEVLDFCKTHRIPCIEGSENDLIKRYYDAVNTGGFDAVIRVTSDCPLLPKHIIERCVRMLTERDYVSNCIYRGWQDGYDIQGASRDCLEWVNENQKDDREHPFMHLDENAKDRTKLTLAGMVWTPLINLENQIHQKLSVDTAADLKRVNDEIQKTR